MSESDTSAVPALDIGRRALLLDPDLFFSVKVSATLKHMAITTTTVRQEGEWTRRLAAERFDIGLVNTAAQAADWRGAIASARAAGLPIIAYGSHVDMETQAQARAAGATRVIANSKLASDLPAIVEQTLRRAQRADDRAETAEQDRPRSDDA
jgi:DNA-binding NtrC family response regulator